MASSPPERGVQAPSRLLVLVLVLGAVGPACSVGGGEGQFEGSYLVEECGSSDDYRMNPSFFGAEAVEDDLLQIRIQRGSGNAGVSDGLWILVRDSYEIQQGMLGQDIVVNNDEGPVGITLYLNSTCPMDRNTLPVTLPATGGTIRFDAIYAQRGDSADVEISAELNDVTFADPRDTERRAQLSGFFRFLYQRGRPAQFFP